MDDGTLIEVIHGSHDEFAAAVAVLDQGVDFASDEINPGQQADCAVCDLFHFT